VHGRLGPQFVVFRADRGGAVPLVGGYGVCERRAVEQDDVAGLGRVLEALARAPELSVRVAPIAARARSAGNFATVADFCEAALSACRGF
jgi:hypothetical protein